MDIVLHKRACLGQMRIIVCTRFNQGNQRSHPKLLKSRKIKEENLFHLTDKSLKVLK